MSVGSCSFLLLLSYLFRESDSAPRVYMKSPSSKKEVVLNFADTPGVAFWGILINVTLRLSAGRSRDIDKHFSKSVFRINLVGSIYLWVGLDPCVFFLVCMCIDCCGPIQAKSSWHLEYLGKEKEAIFFSLGLRIKYKRKNQKII